MLITINELMRLKNEMSDAIKKTKTDLGLRASYGITIEDGVEVSGDKDFNFLNIYNRLYSQLEMFEEICDLFDEFNNKNKMNSLVRFKKNLDYKRDMLLTALERSKEKKSNKLSILNDNSRQVIQVEFKPFVNKKIIKDMIKSIKTKSRDIQNKIEKLNSSEIEIPYDYDELDKTFFNVEEDSEGLK